MEICTIRQLTRIASYLRKQASRLVVLLGTMITVVSVHANPQLGNVSAGNVAISQTPTATEITQTSDKAIINWNSFNINANESTHFQQPAGGVALNRIDPNAGASQIAGKLSATGQIILVNQAGIHFSDTASVNVGSLIASTSDISDANFLSGKYQFDQASSYHNSAIINNGNIHAAHYGLVALIGSRVENNGSIRANLGTVALASGNKFTIDMKGDGLINFAIDEGVNYDNNQSTSHAAVSNKGKIIANGGTILMSAKVAQGVLNNAINMQGIAIAHSVVERNGEIILSGGDQGSVTVSGKLSASGRHVGQRGGNIKVLGKHIELASTSKVQASGYAGGGEILIGGNYQGKGPEYNATNTKIASGARITANALHHGNGGKIIVWSDNSTVFGGTIQAQGGLISGDGGFVETSGKHLNTLGGTVNTLARSQVGKIGTWLLDPTDVTISNSATANESYAGGAYTPSTNSANILASELLANLATTNVNVLTTSGGAGNGDITVDVALTWTAATNLTLTATRNIYLNADITAINGGLILSAVNNAQSITSGSSGSPNAAGVIANINVKNFAMSQGQWYQLNSTLPTFNVTNNFSLPTISNAFVNANVGSFTRFLSGNGTLASPYSIADVFGLQGAAYLSMANAYKLNNDIDASVTAYWTRIAGQNGFIPIGSAGGGGRTGSYNGPNSSAADVAFDGQNHIISNIYIDKSVSNAQFAADYVGGLIGHFGTSVGGIIQNVGMVNVNITGNQYIGGLIGSSNGPGYIKNSFVTGAIVGKVLTVGNGAVGGLVGGNTFTVQNSYSTASVTQALGNAFTAASTLAGLVGSIAGDVQNSYSTGKVTLLSAATDKGLIGERLFGSTTNSYFDSDTSGQSSDLYGGIAKTTIQLQSGLQTGFSGPTWGIIQGDNSAANGSYPYLLSFYPNPNKPRVISGFAPGELAGNSIINLTYNGSTLATTRTGANGFYYFLMSNGAITDGSPFAVSVSNGGSIRSNVIGIAESIGASSVLLNMANNAIRVYSASNGVTNSQLISAINGVSATDSLYSGSSANLILGTATSTIANLATLLSTKNTAGTITTATPNYDADGTINTINYDAVPSTSINFAGTSQIEGAFIITSGAQVYTGALTLGASTALTGTTLSLGAIIGNGHELTMNSSGNSSIAGIFSGTNSSLTKAGSGTLTLSAANTSTGLIAINAGTLSVTHASGLGSGAVSVAANAILDINNTNISTDNALTLNGGTLQGTGTSSFGGAISLAAPADITANNSFTLNGTIDGAATLALSGSGSITLNGAIGQTIRLSGLTSDLSTAINNNVKTTGDQVYNNAVSVSNTNTTFDSNAGAIYFGSTLNGASHVTVNSAGIVTFANAVGNLTPLSSLTTNASNALINGGSITTGSSQTFNNPLALGADTTFTITGTGANTATFSNAITLNNHSLTVTANSAGNNTLDFSDYTAPIQFNFTSAYSGSIDLCATGNCFDTTGTLLSFFNFHQGMGNANSGLKTIANQTNGIYITSGTTGYLSNPFTFTNVAYFSGQGDTSAYFSMPVNINYSNNTVVIDNQTLYFKNVSFPNNLPPVSVPTSNSNILAAAANFNNTVVRNTLSPAVTTPAIDSETQAFLVENTSTASWTPTSPSAAIVNIQITNIMNKAIEANFGLLKGCKTADFAKGGSCSISQ